MDYDPALLSCEALLDLFWAEHDPTDRSWSTQYRAVLFTADAEQERIARESAARLAAKIGTAVLTEIRPLDRFWPAEDYHQKYALRGDARLLALARPSAPDETALRESPLAAKLNAYAGGDLRLEALKAQLASLGWEVDGAGHPEAVRPAAAAAAVTR